MAGPKLSVIFVIYIVCALVEQSAAENYVGGPLPNLLLKSSGTKLKHVAMRLTSSPGPCVVCCRQQRNVERLCMEVEEDQSGLDAASAALETALTELETVRTRALNIAREFGRTQRGILSRALRIRAIDAELASGVGSRAQRQELRDQKRGLRASMMRLRARLPGLRSRRNRFNIAVEEAAATVGFRRQDQSDEQAILERAATRRDRAQESLNSCVARRSR